MPPSRSLSTAEMWADILAKLDEIEPRSRDIYVGDLSEACEPDDFDDEL